MDRDRIATMIPHSGAMCLLDAVLTWDINSVRCLSRRHRSNDNPLRRPDGVLGAVCGLEIAAQAMAVHGQLIAPSGKAVQGYLASVRDLRLRTLRLDSIDGDLIVHAERLMSDGRNAAYWFELLGEGTELLSGRATVLLDPAK